MNIKICGRRFLSIVIAFCIFAVLFVSLPLATYAQSSSTMIDLYDDVTTGGTGWSYDSGTQEFAITGNVTVVGGENHSFNRRFVISGGSESVPLQVTMRDVKISNPIPIVITSGSHVIFVLEDANYFVSGVIDANEANITITGNGYMQVSRIVCKTLTLVGSHIYANGWSESAIDGDVIITGGYLRAYSTSSNGISGSLTLDGDAAVITSGIGGSQTLTRGILSDNASTSSNGSGVVYGNTAVVGSFVLGQDGSLTINNGAQLTIPSGRVFYISSGNSIINNGIIINNGQIVNYGTINNNGALNNNGVFTGSGTITGNAVTGVGREIEWQRPLRFSVDEGKFYIYGNENIVYTEQSDRWEWSAATKTLTLRDFEWRAMASQAIVISDSTSAGLTLNLIGTNTLSTKDTNDSNYGIVYSEQSYYKTAVPLRIKGSGTLNISVGDTVSGECIALDVGALIVESGTLNITVGKGGNTIPGDSIGADLYSLTVNSGVVNVVSGGSEGIVCENDFTLNDGAVTVQSGDAKDYSFGIYTNGHMRISGGTLDVKSGNTTSPLGSSRAVVAEKLTMTGGKVNAVAGKGAEASLAVFVVGPMQLGAWGDLHISGGELNATSDISARESIGILIRGSLFVSGGTVRAIAGSTSESEGSTGILVQTPRSIEFSKGSITAQGMNGAINDYNVNTNTFSAVPINIKAKNYRYWTNTIAQPSGGEGIEYPTSVAFANSQEYRYVQLDSIGSSSGGNSTSGGGGGNNKTTYAVTFDSDGGSAVASVKVAEKGKVTKPANPIKEGYIFEGWYLDNKLYDFYDEVTKNITLIAKWTESDDTTTPSTDEWVNPFSDIKKIDWFYNDVEYAVANGLFQGVNGNEFAPTQPMTRAMLVTVLWRAAGADKMSAILPSPFDDVTDAQWYSAAVAWAAEKGIVSGSGNGLFAPNAEITRQDMATILIRYINFIEYEYVTTREYRYFADEDDIADYAKSAIQDLNKLGIINGKGDDIIDPKGTATRAEVAAMLHRLLELVK